ncbi:MAG TPA: abortive infection family protein [Terriglobales bacterium]|nr:abortive infection family protein [Terriglobales bacterium]
MPFELWEGTNSFGDAFELLYATTTVDKYLELELEADTEIAKSRYKRIAHAMEQINNPIRFIAVDVLMEGVQGVPTPQLEVTSAVVERALSDFEALLHSKGGAVSGVDRIHTALHGYLRAVCNQEDIQYSDEADVTALFGLIRHQHPKLQKHPPGVEAQRMLRGLARIVDALNPVRNRKSMAHPNEELLDEPEALLTAHAVRTLLHYLNSKLR